MSDTVDPIVAPDESAPLSEVVHAHDAPAAADPAPEPAVSDPPAPDAAPEAHKPRRADRHVANLTARLAATQAELAEAQRAREAAESLVRAGKPDDAPPMSAPPTETVQQAAARIVAEREYNKNLQAVIDTGNKDFGQNEFTEKCNIIAGLGANSNPAFMQALVDLPNAAKIVAELADDSDALVALLAKPPAAMAAQLGRMDAKMEQPAPKPISSAPKPPTKVDASAAVPDPDIFDERLSMKEWAAAWDKREAARHKRA